MVLELSLIHGTIVVSLPGRLDLDSAPSVESELQPVIAQHPERVLFDFSKNGYVSSAGIRVLLKTTRALIAGGSTVAFSSLCEQAEYVFEIAGFTKIFTVYTTRDKALKHLNRNG